MADLVNSAPTIATDPASAAQVAAEAIPHTDPFGLFDQWFAEARAAEPNDANAMALATTTPTGLPSVRMVLLKGHGPQLGTRGGFVFYTNSHSRKGAELAADPQVALLFHWKSLRRQIRIEGAVARVADTEADAYFASRAHDSQIGALASDQSAPLAARATFLARYEELQARYAGQDVPRPPHWHGYLVTPAAIEFWIDRPYRLHDRRRFTWSEGGTGGWTSTLLYP